MSGSVKPEPDDPFLAQLDTLAQKAKSETTVQETDDPYLARLDSMHKAALKKPETTSEFQVPGAPPPEQGWFEKWGSPDANLAERAAHGLVEAIPGTVESIAHTLTGYLKPSLEEMRDSRTSLLGRLNLFGHVATDQEIHNAIIRRATGDEVTTGEVEKQGAYFIPVVGQGLLAHDVTTALGEAKTPGDKAETVGNFLGSLVLFSAVHRVIVGRQLRAIEAKGKALASADRMAQARALAIDGENEDALIKGVSHARNFAIPDIESTAQQAEIKARLLDEEDGNVVSTIARAHRELNNDGTTVIPNVPRAGETISRIAKLLKGTEIIFHDNKDGTHDIALAGGDSPLTKDAKLASQFESEGFFKGQEVSYMGKPVIYDGTRLMSQIKVTDLEGNEFYANPDRLRRPGYTRSATLVTELQGDRETPLEQVALGDIRENMSTGDLSQIVSAAFRTGGPGGRTFVGPRYDVARRLAEDAKAVPAEGTPGEYGAVTTDGKFIHQEHLPQYHREHAQPGPDAKLEPRVGPLRVPMGEVIGDKVRSPAPPVNLLRYRAGVIEVNPEAVWSDFRDYNSLMEREPERFSPLPLVDDIRDKYPDAFKLATEAPVGEGPRAFIQALIDKGGIDAEGNDAAQRMARYLNLRDQSQLYNTFDARIERWAQDRGLFHGKESLNGLKRYIAYKQAAELREMYLTDTEKELMKKAQEEGMKESGMTDASIMPGVLIATLKAGEEAPLSIQAYTNGMLLDVAPNGSYLIRDVRTGNLLGRFHTADAAKDFIKHSGQAGGPDLDGGGKNDVPPDAIAGGANKPPVPPPPPNQPLDGLGGTSSDPASGVRDIADYIQNKIRGTVPFLQNYREKAIFADRQAALLGLRTNFTEWFDRASRAVNRRDNQAGPHVRELNAIGNEAMKYSQKKEDFNLAGRYLETATSSELADLMHPDAIKYGEDLAAKNIDTHRAIAFSRQLMDLKKLYVDPAEWEKAGNQLALGQGISPEQLWAARLFNILRERDINVVPIDMVARYAETKIMENNGIDMSREGFAKANGLKPYQMVLANRMESFFKKVADALNIPEYRRIFRYLAHYRMEKTGDFYDAFLKQKGIENDAAATFVSELTRTGEIDAYDLNPLTVGLRYVTGMLNAKEIAPVFNMIKPLIEADIGKFAGHPVGKDMVDELHNVFREGMLGDMRGFPESTNKWTRGVVKEMSNTFKLGLPENVVNTLANAVLAFYANMYVSFRPGKGLQHLNTVMDNYFGRFGVERTANMVKNLANPDAVKASKEYGSQGVLNPYTVGTPLENAASIFSRGINRIPHYINTISEFGLQASGLKKIYEWTKGATFMEARDNAMKHFTDYAFGKQSLDATLKGITIDAYEVPFKNRLMDVLGSNNSEKYVQAANMLGHETSEMIVASYGNMFRIGGWRNLPGRMFGQFGVYPMWNINQTLSQIGSGSLGYRAGVIARRAIYNGLIKGVGDRTGINVNNFLMWHSLNWSGGPAFSDKRQALGNLWNLIYSPFSDDQDAAQKAIKRNLPEFIKDWMKATDTDDYWYLNPAQRIGQALGIPPQKPE